MALNEDDLLRLLHSTEHSYAERKTTNDSRDWVKTIVAFANSLDLSQEGVLFIGATDDGEIETKAVNLDKIQKTLSEKKESIYPPVYCTTKVLKEGNSECIAVIVPGSPAKPHFAGPLYVRDFSKTVVAPKEKYESLLAARTSKTHELQGWIGRQITLRFFSRGPGMGYVLDQSAQDATVLDCNQFYVTVEFNNRRLSYPLSRAEITFDHVQNRLELEVTAPPTS